MVYLVVSEYGIDCFSNLAKLCREYKNIGYYQAYYQLKQNNTIEVGKYKIIKAVIK